MKLLNFLPQEEKFDRMLRDLATEATTSVHYLQVLVMSHDPAEVEASGAAITKAKAQAKRVFEKMTAEVCRTFITPFDREDIQALGLELYHVPKMVEKIKDRILLHRLRPANGDFIRWVDIIERQSQAMGELIHCLTHNRRQRVIYKKHAALHELEDQGDTLLGELLAELFNRTDDARELILRKDTYEMLEDITDYYRDAANVALQIMLKHS